MSMYDPMFEQIIHQFATDNMWGDADGSVEAPCGYFGRLDVTTEDEARALITEWEALLDRVELEAKPSQLVGVWLAQTDSQGNHYVTSYEGIGASAQTTDEEARNMDYDALVTEFDEWAGQDENYF